MTIYHLRNKIELRSLPGAGVFGLVAGISRTMRRGCGMRDLQKRKKELLKDPEVLAEYEASKPEMEVIRALIGARIEQNLTQEQLAQRSGIRQSNISRIENGTCSPTISTLQQLASGMGKKLHIEFV